MAWLLGIAFGLAGLLLLARWFVNAEPRQVVTAMRWLGIGGGGAIALFLLLTGRLGWAIGAATILAPLVLGWRAATRARRSGSGGYGGGMSELTTDFLHVMLDHQSGTISGKVLKGRFAGRGFEELDREELVDLLNECRTADPQSAAVLAAYLQRFHGYEPGQAEPPPSRSDGPMTTAEAYQILGLQPGAGPDEIKEAHRRLMKKLHPDQGGSDYLAAKLNQAKDVLLRP